MQIDNTGRNSEAQFCLNAGPFVGIKDEIDDGIPFEDKMKQLTTELAGRIEEGSINKEIKKQLSRIEVEVH